MTDKNREAIPFLDANELLNKRFPNHTKEELVIWSVYREVQAYNDFDLTIKYDESEHHDMAVESIENKLIGKYFDKQEVETFHPDLGRWFTYNQLLSRWKKFFSKEDEAISLISDIYQNQPREELPVVCSGNHVSLCFGTHPFNLLQKTDLPKYAMYRELEVEKYEADYNILSKAPIKKTPTENRVGRAIEIFKSWAKEFGDESLTIQQVYDKKGRPQSNGLWSMLQEEDFQIFNANKEDFIKMFRNETGLELRRGTGAHKKM